MANGFDLMINHFAAKAGIDMAKLPEQLAAMQTGVKQTIAHFDNKMTVIVNNTTATNTRLDKLEKLLEQLAKVAGVALQDAPSIIAAVASPNVATIAVAAETTLESIEQLRQPPVVAH